MTALPQVLWRPSPNYWRGRAGHVPRAEVKHRIVGTLASAISLFDQPSTADKPRPSTHFCIGYLGGQLVVTQHVDLGDTAWGNGDVRSPTWPLLIPGVNPNYLTISTEHEDGGAANRGRVSEEVWRVSIELSRVLRSGDLDRIRGAGIRISDRPGQTASQLATAIAAWPIDAAHYIDHHQISGPNKPYCFRRWLDDPGFVEGSPSRRDRLLAALAGTPQEDDMLPADMIGKAEEWTTTKPNAPFWTRGCGVGPKQFVINVQPIDSMLEIGREWRIVRLVPTRRYVFMHRDDIDPVVQGGDPAYDAAVFRAIAEGAAALGGSDTVKVKNDALDRILNNRIPALEAAVKQVRESVQWTRDQK